MCKSKTVSKIICNEKIIRMPTIIMKYNLGILQQTSDL